MKTKQPFIIASQVILFFVLCWGMASFSSTLNLVVEKNLSVIEILNIFLIPFIAFFVLQRSVMEDKPSINNIMIISMIILAIDLLYTFCLGTARAENLLNAILVNTAVFLSILAAFFVVSSMNYKKEPTSSVLVKGLRNISVALYPLSMILILLTCNRQSFLVIFVISMIGFVLGILLPIAIYLIRGLSLVRWINKISTKLKKIAT
jgi:hypothetical protein